MLYIQESSNTEKISLSQEQTQSHYGTGAAHIAVAVAPQIAIHAPWATLHPTAPATPPMPNVTPATNPAPDMHVTQPALHAVWQVP